MDSSTAPKTCSQDTLEGVGCVSLGALLVSFLVFQRCNDALSSVGGYHDSHETRRGRNSLRTKRLICIPAQKVEFYCCRAAAVVL